MNSTRIPFSIHQTLNCDKPPRAPEPNGVPLSTTDVFHSEDILLAAEWWESLTEGESQTAFIDAHLPESVVHGEYLLKAVVNRDGAVEEAVLANNVYIREAAPQAVVRAVEQRPLAAGRTHALAIRADGHLWAWGQNVDGQLGDHTRTTRHSPVPIGEEVDWRMVAAGTAHSLGIRADGTLWAWGDNTYGQLGTGSWESADYPVQVGTDADWVTVSTGTGHTLALKEDGTLWGWGRAAFNALTDQITENQNAPVQLGNQNRWTPVLATRSGTISHALRTDGTAWAWGGSSVGMHIPSPTPAPVPHAAN